MKYLTLFLILLAVGCTKPEPIEFDFRGLKIGDPLPEYVTSGHWVNADLEYGKPTNVGVRYFEDGVLCISVYVLDDKFQGVVINGGNTLKEAYIQKHGQPHYTDKDGIYWHTTDHVPLRFHKGKARIKSNDYSDAEIKALEKANKSQVDNLNI